MATRGSAAVLGREDIGQLAVGKAGDLFLIDANDLDLVGTQLDPANLFGTVGYSKPPKLVMAAGAVVAENGRLTGIDEPVITERANRHMLSMLDKAGAR